MQAFIVFIFLLLTNQVTPGTGTLIKGPQPAEYRSSGPVMPDLKGSRVVVYRDLARQCYLYLNEFRSNPVASGRTIGLDLRGISAAPSLTWDPLLAAAAEEKAAEMARENYFGHIDLQGKGMNYRVRRKGYLLPPEWIQNPAANYIESIAANSKDPRHFIDQLIIDKGVEDKAHRQHLLGSTHFYHNASRIGIAIVYDKESVYKYYCCILIAPRFAEVPAEATRN